MRYTVPAILFATPVLADPGSHLHPHDGGAWLLTILGLVLAGGVLWAVTARK